LFVTGRRFCCSKRFACAHCECAERTFVSGAVYEEIWNRLIEAEKKGDPEKRGYAVLVTIERAEDLAGQPLT
jgi:hypothetical protein